MQCGNKTIEVSFPYRAVREISLARRAKGEERERRPEGMASDERKSGKEAAKPEWADGLRQLYDSVVDEPLPDSFKDLLDKLDAPDTKSSS